MKQKAFCQIEFKKLASILNQKLAANSYRQKIDMVEETKTQESGEQFVKSKLDRLRHSTAHVMAQAIQGLYPGAKLAIGPAIKDGFYYDVDADVQFSESDLEKIENRMSEIVKQAQPFERKEMSREEAIKFFEKKGETYKVEIIQGIEADTVSTYWNNDFVDLCRGPHLENTSEVRAFKLLSIAGAYWRGDERNKMLQRIYGTAFASPKELKQYLHRLEEAKKRDHRKLGRELDLFSFHEESPGIPFFHPRGTVLYDQLTNYWREEHRKEDYVECRSPIILNDELWKKSGHYDHYKENMYFSEIEETTFAIKPMNCPGGVLIFKNTPKSYRDLPIKLAELGLVHRHEKSGVLHGLFRVKAFTIDDAHIYCVEDQIQEEIGKCLALITRIYKAFGFDKIQIELSTRPEDSMGSDEIWEKATTGLENALKNNDIDYYVSEGSGAFYGPKIDFHIEDSIGRTWQCGTIQLDFSMPERFDIDYVGKDGKKHRPVMVHRAVFGSVERFLGILIEHFGGDFPLWLSPVQVLVATISEKQDDYAKEVYAALKAAGIRAEIDLDPEKIGYKIRKAETGKTPYVAVVGDKEVESRHVALRARGRKDLGSVSIEGLITQLKEEIETKKQPD